MSFRLRLIYRMILWLFQPAPSPQTEFRADYRVWPNEAEISVVENARYGYLFVLERYRLIFSTDMWKIMFKNKWTTVMGAQIFKVKRPLKRFQKFSIITKPLTWDDKWIYFEQRIESQGKVYCTGVISVIFLAKDRKIPTAEVLQLMNVKEASPPLSDSVRKFIAAAETLDI